MLIRWTDAALRELDDAIDFIEADNPLAAARMNERIVVAARNLGTFPRQGRPGRVADTRELPVPGTPFLVVYSVGRDGIDILRLLHGARRYP